MVKICFVQNCNNSENDEQVQLYSLPASNELKKLWLKAIKAEEQIFVCSNHFQENDFDATGNLIEYAIPSKLFGEHLGRKEYEQTLLLLSSEDRTLSAPETRLYVSSTTFISPSETPSTQSASETEKHLKTVVTTISNSGQSSPTNYSHSAQMQTTQLASKSEQYLGTAVPTLSNLMCHTSQVVSISPAKTLTTLTASESEYFKTGDMCERNQFLMETQPTTSKIQIQEDSSTSAPSSPTKYRFKKGTAKRRLEITSSPEGIKKKKAKLTKRGTLKKKFRPPRFFGDCETDDMLSPRKVLRNWRVAKETIESQRKTIKTLRQRSKRLDIRISNFKDFIKDLKKKCDLTENAEIMLNSSMSPTVKTLLDRMIKKRKPKYDHEIKAFAITLQFYSARAYSYVREKFNNILPHPSTITKWFQSFDGAPGFTAESLKPLQAKVNEMKLKDEQVYCNLVMDEMHIRSQQIWSKGQLKGHINIGTKFDDDVPLATQALVFMLVAINSDWKIPVGYFLINGLSSQERANLVCRCLEFVHQSGVEIISITFDGAPSNLSMLSHLGADVYNIQNIKPFFPHPITKKPIYIIPDACHMLKLIRNCLATVKTLTHDDGYNISWQYFQKLVNIQEQEGLHAGTKIKRQHIRWFEQKMKVKLAAQTFSRSVADAFDFLSKDLQHPDFQEVEYTSMFCRLINNLFDIFNSRNPLCSYVFKQPIWMENQRIIFYHFEECKQLFSKLKMNNEPILHARRKTGFLGFLIGMESVKHIFQNYILNSKLKHLKMYRFSQDHLELFFGSIRSRGGCNNNPNVLQFETAYKRLLLHTDIKAPTSANVISLESTSILHGTTSTNSIHVNNLGENMLENIDYLKTVVDTRNEYEASDLWHLTTYQNDVISYIAGFVVKRLKLSVTCGTCMALIESPTSQSKLEIRKDYGRLNTASDFIIILCKSAEKVFRQEMHNMKTKKKLLDFLTIKTLSFLPTTVFDFFSLEHILEDNPSENHAIQVSKAALKHYFNLRMHHQTKINTNSIIKERVRHKFTKIIHFKNQ